MTQWRIFCSNGMPVINGETWYSAIYGSTVRDEDTVPESHFQCKFYTAFDASDLRCKVTENTLGTGTMTLRDDEADTSVSLTCSTTGWLEDVTDSVTIAATSVCNYVVEDSDALHG